VYTVEHISAYIFGAGGALSNELTTTYETETTIEAMEMPIPGIWANHKSGTGTSDQHGEISCPRPTGTSTPFDVTPMQPGTVSLPTTVTSRLELPHGNPSSLRFIALPGS
jgi:hypothetical protein